MDVDTDNAFPRTKIGRDHQMRDQFRHGKVNDRKMDDKRGPLVRVQYLDKQGLISQWLPVKQFGSRLTVHLYVPKIGDDVNVNMLANGSEDGFVDGSFFNEGNPPPEGVDIDTRHFQSEDETVIEYREIDSTFNLNDKNGPVHVKATSVFVTADLVIHLKAPTIILEGFVDHRGDMVSTGTHTDANGVHCSLRSARTYRDLAAEIDELRDRVRFLEEKS